MNDQELSWLKKYIDSRFHTQTIISLIALISSFVAVGLMLMHEAGYLLKHQQ